MARAGVGILAGTDTPNPYSIPGFAVHDELELLVEAGLSPARALRAVTADSARFLGVDGERGTVTTGKAADMVVLDSNPLVDIRNTQKIHAIVTRGNLISSEMRQQILDGVEAYANSFRVTGAASAKAVTRGAATGPARRPMVCPCH
jgi:imidazolonepropionase-like amidohydrolase